MAINFPDSPVDGQQYTNTTTGVDYIYNSSLGGWKASLPVSGYTGSQGAGFTGSQGITGYTGSAGTGGLGETSSAKIIIYSMVFGG